LLRCPDFPSSIAQLKIDDLTGDCVKPDAAALHCDGAALPAKRKENAGGG
jgi:hypothetical protein